MSQSDKNYVDEFGDPTFYVMNIATGHVHISDLNLTIPVGKVMDLREYRELDDLKKSPDLRYALSPKVSLLKRLTKEEYQKLLEEQTKKEEILSKTHPVTNPEIGTTNAEGNIVKEVKVNIRPKCQSMVEKLKLYGNSQTREKGISPEQFLLWLDSYVPTDDEKEYMVSVISDKQIRQKLASLKSVEDIERENKERSLGGEASTRPSVS